MSSNQESIKWVWIGNQAPPKEMPEATWWPSHQLNHHLNALSNWQNLVVILEFTNEQNFFNTLKDSRLSQSGVTLAGYHQELDFKTFSAALKEFQFHTWVGSVGLSFSDLAELAKRKNDHQQVLAETRLKMHELESLTGSMELLIQERVTSIDVSENEEKQNLARLRLLLRLVQTLAQMEDVEDLVSVLQNSLEIDAMIYISVSSKDPEQLYLMSKSGGDWVRVEAFKKLLAVGSDELGKNWVQYHLPSSHPASLWVERKKVSILRKWPELLADAARILTVVIDRWIFETESQEIGKRWVSSFQSFTEPLALISSEFEVLSSNKSFKKHEGVKCFEVFANRNSPCEGCPLLLEHKQVKMVETLRFAEFDFEVTSHRLPSLQVSDSLIYIHSYEDVTEERDFFLSFLQSERLYSLAQLSGQVSHELTNPISGVASLAQWHLSQTEILSEQTKSDLQEIDKAAKRILNLIQNFSDFATGEVKIRVSATLPEVIEKTLPLLKVATRSIRIVKSFNDHSKILCNTSLISQVIFNLVHNAIQSIGEKPKAQIFIETLLSTDKKFVQLKIKDEGGGIPQEILAHLFKPFKTSKLEGQGTGLGLFIVKRIIDLHKGTVSVETSLQGSVFTISLPTLEEV